MLSTIVLPVLLLFWFATIIDSAGWSYYGKEGPAHWREHFPKSCDGKEQSPIDFSNECITSKNLGHIKFKGYPTCLTDLRLVNNGHSATIEIINPDIYITKGGLKGKYGILGLHFHWGSNCSVGSEHTIDGKAFPIEMHIVHYNTKYDADTAANNKDGLAVLGILFEEKNQLNPALIAITNALSDIENQSAEQCIADFNLKSLLPKQPEHFYRYQGSLTTPNCNEAVTWTVFCEKNFIGSDQLAQFRLLKDPKQRDMSNNFRPPQPIGDRKVFENKLHEGESDSFLQALNKNKGT